MYKIANFLRSIGSLNQHFGERVSTAAKVDGLVSNLSPLQTERADQIHHGSGRGPHD